MDTIWKYELNIEDQQEIMMPEHAVILTVKVQHGTPCLWARVNPNNKLIPRLVITCGTGHEVFGNAGAHIGSYLLENGDLVFHVFEGIPSAN